MKVVPKFLPDIQTPKQQPKFQNIENFVAKYNCKGETNGKLLIYSEKENPAIRLQSFADEVLITNGLLPKEDFVFIKAKVMDGFHYEHSAFIGIEHTDCKNIKWLGSIITNEGNFIWYSNPNISAFEKDAYFRLLKHLYFRHYDQTKLNPRIFNPLSKMARGINRADNPNQSFINL